MDTWLYWKWIANKDLPQSTDHRELCSMLCANLDGTGSLGGNGFLYMYGWVPLLSTWNYNSIVYRWWNEVAQLCPTLCDPVDCVGHQTPLSVGFPRQENGVGCRLLLQGNLPDPGIEPGSPTLQADALTSEPPGKPQYKMIWVLNK